MTDISEPFEKHFSISQDGQTVIDVLAANIPQLSKQKLKLVMKYGAVWLTPDASPNKTSRVRRAKSSLRSGDTLHVYYNERALFGELQPATLISDEVGYSVWNKPAGMFSQGTKWGDHSAICRWIALFGFERENIKERPVMLVHRLDRATNGLIVVAHSKAIAAKLSLLFETRQINKFYSALVANQFPLEKYSEIEFAIENKAALTKVIDADYNANSNQSSVSLKIESGRKHQIRKHFSMIGFPILNDRLYGSDINAQDDEQIGFGELSSNLKLKACRVEFICPITQELKKFEISGY